MMESKTAVKGSASMWALSSDKQTVRLTVSGGDATTPLRVEFDRDSLEATLSMLVQMHFEMLRTTPAEVPLVRH